MCKGLGLSFIGYRLIDIFYEVKYLIHCIIYKGLGFSFTGNRLIVVFTGMKYQTN